MDFLNALLSVWLELAPWLLLGAFIASLLHVLLPPGWVQRHLGGRFSVLKAVLLGVPLPLCSCGVIPAGIGLRKDGATRGASVAFITATPQTGVDSLLVTSTFLGWPFALFKVGAALVTGLTAGLLTDALDQRDGADAPAAPTCAEERPQGLRANLRAMWDHGVDLVRTIWYWIVIGVVASAAITTFLPHDLFAQTAAWGGILASLIALAVSLPLYVCATASVPIAAALVATGMPTSAALVFLMAGPATNVATIGAVYRAFGARATAVYLGTLTAFSIAFGLLFDNLLPAASAAAHAGHHDHSQHPWWAVAAGIGLALLMLVFAAQDGRTLLQRLMERLREPAEAPTLSLPVEGMKCSKCAGRLERAVRELPEIQSVSISVEEGTLTVTGAVAAERLLTTVRDAGFTPGEPHRATAH